jgi:hypothetical protein
VLRQFQQMSSEIGTANAILYGCARALRRTTSGGCRLHKYLLVAQPVGQRDLTPAQRGRSIDVREADTQEIRATDFGRPAHIIEYRLQHQCRCLTARKGGELIGFQWFTLHDYPEDEIRCLFRMVKGHACAWDFDVVVHPQYRVLPVFSKLWDRCNSLLRTAGIDITMSRIDAFNPVSRRAHARLGAREVGWAMFLVAGRAQLAIFSSRPWLHLSLSDRSIPVWPVSSLARRGNSTHVSDRVTPIL